MVYTVTKLITQAYYKSGVVSKDFQTITGEKLSSGLDLLNGLLGDKVVDFGAIPYESTFTFNSSAGQEEYVIPNCISIDTLTFIKDTVRYSMRKSGRNYYFGSSRVETVTSLPFQWNFERNLGGGILSIYFQPDQDYPMEIRGVFRLSEVTLNQDLELSLDRFYINFLMYELAREICIERLAPVPPELEKRYLQQRAFIEKRSRKIDMTMQKVSTLQRNNTGSYWAQVNIGRGFYPTSS